MIHCIFNPHSTEPICIMRSEKNKKVRTSLMTYMKQSQQNSGINQG